MAKPMPAKKSRPKTASNDPNFASPVQKDIPEYLKKNEKERAIMDEYKELVDQIQFAVNSISAKEIADFRNEINPAKATIKIGFALVLLLKEIDNSMIIDTGKRSALVFY